MSPLLAVRGRHSFGETVMQTTAYQSRKVTVLGALSLWLVTIGIMAAPTPVYADKGFSISWGKSIQGSGKTVEVARTVPAFNRISAQDGIQVILRRATAQKLTVKADDNIEPMVETVVESDMLKLRIRPRTSIRLNNAITVSIDYTQLNAVALKDGAQADIDPVKGAAFSATVKDGAQLRMPEVDVTELDVSVSDGGSARVGNVTAASVQRYRVSDGARLTVERAVGDRVMMTVQDGARMSLRSAETRLVELSVSDGAHADIAGVAQRQIYALSDAASVDASKLQGASAQVRASDGSSLKLGVLQTLNAEIADGSSVRYTGEPAITQRLRDGASLKRM